LLRRIVAGLSPRRPWFDLRSVHVRFVEDIGAFGEIHCRLTLGNKAYCASQFFFKSKLVSKKSKLKLYWKIVRPTVTYGCGTWVLTETIKNELMVFERKVLRRIFGSTKERDGTWRIKTNDELDELIRHKNIINHIKAQRLSWFGHLHRVPEERMVKRVYKWKPMLTRPLGRPKNRWEDILYIKMNVCLYICLYLIQIHISEPIGTKLCTHLPRGL